MKQVCFQIGSQFGINQIKQCNKNHHVNNPLSHPIRMPLCLLINYNQVALFYFWKLTGWLQSQLHQSLLCVGFQGLSSFSIESFLTHYSRNICVAVQKSKWWYFVNILWFFTDAGADIQKFFKGEGGLFSTLGSQKPFIVGSQVYI